MRTDCKIDNRKIPCPNATTFGYAKRYAKAGNVIHYRDTVGNHIPLASSDA